MAKRVFMIAPYDVLTGNASGSQKLKYARNDNPAFEAPDGRQYARNYKPRYIISRRSSDGVAHFSVRTKSAVNNTAVSRLQQAALGGAAALAAVIIDDPQWATQMDLLLSSFYNGVKAGKIKEKTIRAWMTSCILPSLKEQRTDYYFPLYQEDGLTPSSVTFYSPWGDPQFDSTRNPDAPQDILVKFWAYLTPGAIVFQVAGRIGISNPDTSFAALCSDDRLNILGLEVVASVVVGTEAVTNAVAYGPVGSAGSKLTILGVTDNLGILHPLTSDNAVEKKTYSLIEATKQN